MTTGLDALTAKEKDALRLLLRGHDAKSSARELGLSVHTVNERLREARRKLGVTSSREAARLLLAEESAAPETRGDKHLGDAAGGAEGAEAAPSATRRSAGTGLAATAFGVLAMSLLVAALLLPAAPLGVAAPAAPPVAATAAATAAAEADAAAAARAAEAFLKLLDESRWADSYAATGTQFRKLNTLERWAEVSDKARPPLGTVVTRELVGNEFVPAPPEGYRLVKFRSRYANGTVQTESLSLAYEDGGWKVAGILFD